MNPLNTQAPVRSTRQPAGRTAAVARRAAVALLLAGGCAGAFAQYKVVGPDGRVTYTDTPPAAAARPAATDGTGGSAATGGGLPYDTRQAAARYPVTLYAAKGCQACDGARQWLRGRGVPFAEYAIDNNASIEQLQQRFGTTTVPVITIGGQTVTGFSQRDLQSYVDAAGYPAQARLVGYAWPAAVPLASGPAPATRAAPAPASPAPAPAPAAAPTSSNGIQF